MKKISILIPCFNEAENVELMCKSLINVIDETLSHYDYEIVFSRQCAGCEDNAGAAQYNPFPARVSVPTCHGQGILQRQEHR